MTGLQARTQNLLRLRRLRDVPHDSLIAAYADFLEWRQHDLANYLQSVFWMLRYLADAGFAEEEKANVLAYCAHAVVTE